MRMHPGRGRAWLAALLCLPATARAHAFGERYDLPVPLSYFVVGAALTVALSFVVAARFMRATNTNADAAARTVALDRLWSPLRLAGRLLGIALFGAMVVAGVFGTRNPEMNFAPVLVWIIWWVGLSYAVAFCGNVWPMLDPWRTLFTWADALAHYCGRKQGIGLGIHYPERLGAWPAVFLLLLFVWLEVIYTGSALPSRVAGLALAWSAMTLAGMVCFGRAAWQRNADVFSIYFSTLGRFALLGSSCVHRSITLRVPGTGLLEPVASLSMAAFVIAMLAGVLFDGLLGSSLMAILRSALVGRIPLGPVASAYVVGTVGLLVIWVMLFGVYLLACALSALLLRTHTVATIVRMFALTLVPIVIAYNVAHYFSYLLVQGQLIIPLLSDPLGYKWNLFGTADYYPDIALLDARTTWHLAIASIVTGHVISIWLAHRLALSEFGTPQRAVLASIPLTCLMVLYTVISLLIMAEPLVKFTPVLTQ